MNKLLYLIFIVFLLSGCSLNKNASFWSSSKVIDQEKDTDNKIQKKIKIFSKDKNITCTVSDNGKIIFREKETTLSGSALLITNEMGYDWGQVQGAGYWCYQGKTLRELVSEK